MWKTSAKGKLTIVYSTVEVTPVANDDLSFYEGNYSDKNSEYELEIRLDANKNLAATLRIPGEPDLQLKKVLVKDAYFTAMKENDNGVEEIWEGVFMNRSDNGNVEFGLGIILPKQERLKIPRIFLKKILYK